MQRFNELNTCGHKGTGYISNNSKETTVSDIKKAMTTLNTTIKT